VGASVSPGMVGAVVVLEMVGAVVAVEMLGALVSLRMVGAFVEARMVGAFVAPRMVGALVASEMVGAVVPAAPETVGADVALIAGGCGTTVPFDVLSEGVLVGTGAIVGDVLFSLVGTMVGDGSESSRIISTRFRDQPPSSKGSRSRSMFGNDGCSFRFGGEKVGN